MLYWFEFAGATVYADRRRLGQIENLMLDPAKKNIIGFIMEKRSRDLWPRYFHFLQIQSIGKDYIQLKNKSDIRFLNGALKKQMVQAEDFINQSILDEKMDWVGRVVDFAFDPVNGMLREVIVSTGFLDDLWHGRKKMPVLNHVEFSDEFIHIDQDTREEIALLDKGLKEWLDREK